MTAGRSGWVATVTDTPGAASAWGRPAVSGTTRLRREAAGAVEYQGTTLREHLGLRAAR